MMNKHAHIPTEWIQLNVQWQPPSGHAGRSGIWKAVLRYQTQVWLTENTTKSSGLRSCTSDLYAIASAQPLASASFTVWKAVDCAPGQGQLLP